MSDFKHPDDFTRFLLVRLDITDVYFRFRTLEKKLCVRNVFFSVKLNCAAVFKSKLFGPLRSVWQCSTGCEVFKWRIQN